MKRKMFLAAAQKTYSSRIWVPKTIALPPAAMWTADIGVHQAMVITQWSNKNTAQFLVTSYSFWVSPVPTDLKQV